MIALLLLGACAHEPDAEAGAEKYGVFCESCHGADGTAGVQVDGVAAADLNATVPDLDDSALAGVIQQGTGAMPAQQLDDDETADVIAYLRAEFAP